jgi:alpha-tubulin suppressor-like RCC1 family protein
MGPSSCWGLNSSGQLGDGSTTDRFHGVAVSGFDERRLALAGTNHTCASRTNGSRRLLGRQPLRPARRRLDRLEAVGDDGAGLGAIAAVEVGDSHSCARRASGGVACWGANFSARSATARRSPA